MPPCAAPFRGCKCASVTGNATACAHGPDSACCVARCAAPPPDECLSALVVTAGGHACVVSGDCVSDGPGNYGNNEQCTVEVRKDGLLSATEFDTGEGNTYYAWSNGYTEEKRKDDLSIYGPDGNLVQEPGGHGFLEFAREDWPPTEVFGGGRYSGRLAGPQNVAVRAGSRIEWISDLSDTAPGWTICWAGMALLPVIRTQTYLREKANYLRMIGTSPACCICFAVQFLLCFI